MSTHAVTAAKALEVTVAAKPKKRPLDKRAGDRHADRSKELRIGARLKGDRRKRWEKWTREGETFVSALDRLMDAAGV